MDPQPDQIPSAIPEPNVSPQSNIPPNFNELPKKKNNTIIIAIAGIAIIAIIIVVIAMSLGKGKDVPDSQEEPTATVSEKEDNEESMDDSEDPDENTDIVEEETDGLGTVENKGKKLPGGKYVAGEDISPGKYNLIYKTKLSEDDYWSNDYLYIIRDGSKGSEKTMGGTKFDERFGSVDYDEAKEGKSFYLNLKEGDVITVENAFGTWTYGSEINPNMLESSKNKGKDLPEGTYIAGEDITPGKYIVKYKTSMGEDDYWSNDYFYITRSGSEGKEKTMGGTKFDERFGPVAYKYAKKGITFYVHLDEGDKIVVESGYGSWTY